MLAVAACSGSAAAPAGSGAPSSGAPSSGAPSSGAPSSGSSSSGTSSSGTPSSGTSSGSAPTSAATTSSAATPGGGPPTVRAAVAGWRLPAALSREVVLPAGAGLAVAGGLTPAGTSSAAVYLLDPRSGAVVGHGRLAAPVHDAAGAVLGGRDYVLGGGTAGSSAAVQRLVPGARAVRSGTLPRVRSDAAAVTVAGATYLIGGYDGSAWARGVLRTADGRRFVTVARLPVPVRYPALAAVGPVVWIAGGQSPAGPTDVIQRLDTRTGRITVTGRLPARSPTRRRWCSTGRSSCAAAGSAARPSAPSSDCGRRARCPPAGCRSRSVTPAARCSPAPAICWAARTRPPPTA